MPELVDLRLLRPYRNYRAGLTIKATPALAEQLVSAGLAVRDLQQSLLQGAGRQTAERAVASPTAIETR